MIHDALWLEAPNKEKSEVRRLMRRMMTTTDLRARVVASQRVELPTVLAMRTVE